MNVDSIPWHQLTSDEVLELHAEEMKRKDGRKDPPIHGCVEGSVGNAYSAVLYSVEGDEGPNLLAAAAYILFYLSKNHCFTDGNKRAAWASLVHLLYINGLRVVATQDDAAALVNSVATGTLGREETVSTILTWLGAQGRIEAFEPPES